MYTASHKFLVVTTASFVISRILSPDHVHSTRPQLLTSKYIIKNFKLWKFPGAMMVTLTVKYEFL